jgi:hypothetical protein
MVQLDDTYIDDKRENHRYGQHPQVRKYVYPQTFTYRQSKKHYSHTYSKTTGGKVYVSENQAPVTGILLHSILPISE